MNKTARMKELIPLLNEAAKAYYQEDREIMSNFEYDKRYDELVELERETGITYTDSPTKKIGHEVLAELPKEAHPEKMLSLDKTKDRELLREWLNGKEGVLSWKLDGLTVVLTYQNGSLKKAVTRGNGEIGEVITSNMLQSINLPLKIPYKKEVVLRGEAVISYSDFEKINEQIEDMDARYKNPRNLCSGSVRQLDSAIAAKRNIQWIAFRMVTQMENLKTVTEQFEWLENQGFQVVPYKLVSPDNILSAIDEFESDVIDYEIPSDGLVITYNDIGYGKSLGSTSKFPRHSFAFKWKDETAETTLIDIRWQTTRTGVINPVAIFEPVELEGTTVNRATANNVGIIQELQLGIGDKIQVYKANMIIPQIAENLTRSGNLEIPDKCPACGGDAEIFNGKDSKILCCMNPHCNAKLVSRLKHFCSKDAMDIVGFSEATIEKLCDEGWIEDFIDIYTLQEHKKQWIEMPGFAESSVKKKLTAIEKSKATTSTRFLYSLGIPGIGKSQTKDIVGTLKNWQGFIQAIEQRFDFSTINGIGEVRNQNIYDWYETEFVSHHVKELSELMEFQDAVASEYHNKQSIKLKGLSFAITGSLQVYKNRKELQDIIIQNGGNVVSSVSKKTDYLVNNDLYSATSKNIKARELQIPIITENMFKDIL